MGPLTLTAMLSAASGFVDAHVFSNLTQVFVANMSGNVVLFGMATGRRDWSGAGGPGVAIVAFTVGVALGTHFYSRSVRESGKARPELVVSAEIVILSGMAAILALAPEGSGRVYGTVVVGRLAMGLQTCAIRWVGESAVSTTYESGVIARLGEAGALTAERNGLAGERACRVRSMVVLGSVVVAYAGGAAAGSAFGAPTIVLVIPVGALVVVAAALAHDARHAQR